jgi:hypothetical protein
LNIQRDLSVIFKDKEWFRKTLIGGTFLMIPPLFIFSFGFIARFIHDRLETGNKELPTWENWGLLFLKGFEWGLIVIFYFVIPLFIISLLPGSVIEFMVNPKFIIANLKIGGFFILYLSFFLGFAAIFFLPMGLILFSDSGSFVNAIRFKKIYEHIKNNLTPYLLTYVLTVFLLVFDFFLHLGLNAYIIHFGSLSTYVIHFALILAYFLFVWIGFTILLISASLFIESF